MRDSMKVIIGFSCTWGVFVLVGVLFSAFTMGVNDPDFLRAALFLYGFSFLPISLVSIRSRKAAAFAFLALTCITASAFLDANLSSSSMYFELVAYTSTGDRIFELVFAAIPALVAILLLRHKEREPISD